MRDPSTGSGQSANGLQYFLTDHLGSTVAITDSNGTLTSQQRYLPFGGTRTNVTTPNSPGTDFGYTGQRDLDPGMGGLMDYKARFYSPILGRFIQPDTIIPNLYNSQAFNRYSYVGNSPVNFNDPSGHRACGDGEVIDCDGKKNDQGGSTTSGGCSVKNGRFNGNYSCTAEDFNGATVKQRRDYFNDMLSQADPNLPDEFTNINGILLVFISRDEAKPNSALSWGDAGILVSIQNGLALSREATSYIPGDISADSAWKTFFDLYFNKETNRNDLEQQWGRAEQAGTGYGKDLALAHGLSFTAQEQAFYWIGDTYRSGLLNRQDPEMLTVLAVDAHIPGFQPLINGYSWFFDTSSTTPVIHVAPVYWVADFILASNP